MDRLCLNFSTGTLPAGLTHRLLFVVVGCFTWVDGAFSFCDSHVALLGGNAVRARSVIEAPGAARLSFIWPTSQGSQGSQRAGYSSFIRQACLFQDDSL